MRAAILALLGEQPMHGYQIIQELESRSNGLWRPSPGSIYPTLQLFEDEGLVSASEVDGKRVFDLTAAGRERLAEAGPAGAKPWEAVARETPEELGRLREGIRALMHATHQVAHAGSPSQSARALEVLTEARRKIYAILAEDESEAEAMPEAPRRRSTLRACDPAPPSGSQIALAALAGSAEPALAAGAPPGPHRAALAERHLVQVPGGVAQLSLGLALALDVHGAS